jgi:hypothetical protein
VSTTREDLVDGCARAQLAELVWLDAEGHPDWAVVVPFLLDGAPVVALTYDRLELARQVASSPQAALALATPAFLRGARATVVSGRPRLEEDPRGQRFRERLVDQELAKNPPARRLADSLLLQREHWWYLPRLLLTFEGEQAVQRIEAPGAVAAVAGPDGLVVDGCDLDDLGTRARIRRTLLPDGPAALLEHGGEVPELEFRWHRCLRGPLRGDELTVLERDEIGSPGKRPGVLARWREQRRLERGCRRGLRAAGHV